MLTKICVTCQIKEITVFVKPEMWGNRGMREAICYYYSKQNHRSIYLKSLF